MVKTVDEQQDDASVKQQGNNKQTQHNQALWAQVQEHLKHSMSSPSFETWISPLQLTDVQGESVTLTAESTFIRDRILRQYRQDLQQIFSAVLDTSVKVNVVVETPPDDSTANKNTPADDVDTFNKQGPGWRPWTPRSTKSNLNPRYTFEQFVVGQHNRFCHAAALAVAETPGQSYNPFFIYGGVGLGKTHLMQAVGHFVHTHHQDLVVRYVTAEQFTNELIHAISTKDMVRFRNRYRKIDILMIDDIQFLEGKERTQEEVFHTFNTLHEAGKQIILSSDRPPKNLSRLEQRLKSRFEWGLIADIQAPDYETRLAILQNKAERENLPIPQDVLAYIAEVHPRNIRELEGAINKVAAYTMLTHTPADLDNTKQLLGMAVDHTNASCHQIVETTADYYHLRATDLKSPSRAKDVSHARQVAIYLIREMTDMSFPKIGEAIGGRKHSTILYAYEKIKDQLDAHPVLKQQIQEITTRIKSLG